MHCCDLQKSDFKTQTWPHEEGASNIRSGWHFKKKGYSVHDMKVTVVEKVHSNDDVLREERESMYIKNFNTKYKGINRIC